MKKQFNIAVSVCLSYLFVFSILTTGKYLSSFQQPPPLAVAVVGKVQVQPEKKKPTEKEEIKHAAKVVSKLYKTLTFSQAKELVQTVYKQSKINKLNPRLVLGLIAVESSFVSNAVSEQGAFGFMQVMEVFHEDKVKGRDLSNHKVNVQVGTKILSDCFKKHSSFQKALGCYNGSSNPKVYIKYASNVLSKTNQIFKHLT